MRNVMRWLGVMLLLVLLVTAALFAVARLAGSSAEQREALALLEAEDELPGRNAFPLLWLLEYDVPESQWQAIVDEDVALINDALRQLESSEAGFGEHDVMPQQSVADGRFPRLSVADDDPPYCAMRDFDCIGKVRANRDAYAQRLAQEQVLIGKVRSLADYGHYRSQLPPSLHGPIPRFSGIRIALAANALDFVDGRVDAALASTCRDTLAWRRMSVHGDSLIVSMIGSAMVNGNAQNFARMLAELPRHHVLPAECAEAFDPDTLPVDLCPAMRGEARYSASMLLSREAVPSSMFAGLLYDAQGTRAMLAPTLAHACTDDVRQRMKIDAPIPFSPQPGSLWRLECAGNLAGCVLADIAAPAHHGYLERMQDMHAMLRVMHLMLEMHASDEPLSSEAIVAHLERESARGRRIDFDAESGELSIALRGYSDSPRWQVPLPGSLLAKDSAVELQAAESAR